MQTAIVHARTRTSTVVVHELSFDGAKLVGGIPLARGELVTIIIQHVTLHARVIGVEPVGDGRVATEVEFRDVSPVARYALARQR